MFGTYVQNQRRLLSRELKACYGLKVFFCLLSGEQMNVGRTGREKTHQEPEGRRRPRRCLWMGLRSGKRSISSHPPWGGDTKMTEITRHQNSFISLSSSLIAGSSAHRYMEKIHLFTQKDLCLRKASILAEETEIPETKIHLKY